MDQRRFPHARRAKDERVLTRRVQPFQPRHFLSPPDERERERVRID